MVLLLFGILENLVTHQFLPIMIKIQKENTQIVFGKYNGLEKVKKEVNDWSQFHQMVKLLNGQ